MRKYYLLLILLTPFLFAGSVQRHQMSVISQYNAAAAAPAHIFTETFDGASACGDGSHTNCDNLNAWATVEGTPDYNATVPTLEGTNNLEFVGDTQVRIGLGSSYSDIYVAFRFNRDVANSGDDPLLRSNDDEQTYDFPGYVNVDDDSGHYHIECQPYGGTNVKGATALSDDTTYYIQVRFYNAGANNMTVTAWNSTDGSSWVEGSPDCTSTDGTTNEDAAYIHWDLGDAAGTYNIDDIKIDTSFINW